MSYLTHPSGKSARPLGFAPGATWAPTQITPARPGADAHLRVPSRRGDARVEHRGPIGIASRVPHCALGTRA